MIFEIVNVYKNAVNFTGSSGRKTFITFFAYHILFIGSVSAFTEQIDKALTPYPFLIITIAIFYLWTELAYISLAIRRIRDTGKSPFFIFVPFYNLYLLFKKLDYMVKHTVIHKLYCKIRNVTKGDALW